jgi:hypothetical protein
VDRLKLLGPLGATASEFAQACASMADLCPDLVATAAQRKRGAQDLPVEQRALIDRTGPAGDDDVAGSSEDEVEDDGQVGYRIDPKRQRQRVSGKGGLGCLAAAPPRLPVPGKGADALARLLLGRITTSGRRECWRSPRRPAARQSPSRSG